MRVKFQFFCFTRNTVVVCVCYDRYEVRTVNKAQSQQKSTVAVFGFSGEQNEIINGALTKNAMELFCAAYATDLFAIDHLMIIVNVDNMPEDELRQLCAYYRQVPAFSESVVLVGDSGKLDVSSRMVVYGGFDELEENLKYLLLAAKKQRKNAESFSRSISYALIILRMITENPGISSKEIADRLELSPRSVTRYIETLNMSGESIVYSRKQNGWSLEHNESLLKL